MGHATRRVDPEEHGNGHEPEPAGPVALDDPAQDPWRRLRPAVQHDHRAVPPAEGRLDHRALARVAAGVAGGDIPKKDRREARSGRLTQRPLVIHAEWRPHHPDHPNARDLLHHLPISIDLLEHRRPGQLGQVTVVHGVVADGEAELGDPPPEFRVLAHVEGVGKERRRHLFRHEDLEDLLAPRGAPAVIEGERNHFVVARSVPDHAGIVGRNIARPERQEQEHRDSGSALHELHRSTRPKARGCVRVP